jgi:hypothetical protein
LHDEYGDGPSARSDARSGSFDSKDQEASTSAQASTPPHSKIASSDEADMSLGAAIKQSKSLPAQFASAAKAKKKGIGTLMREASKNMAKTFGNSPGRRFSREKSNWKSRNNKSPGGPNTPSGRR